MAIVERRDTSGKRHYQVRIAVRDADGRRRNQTIGTYPTKREAEKAEREALTNRDRGTLLRPDTTTTAELLDEWLRVEMPRTVRPENREVYTIVINKHLKPAIGSIPARKLTVEHVEKLLACMQERGLSSSLVTKTRMRLASALRMGQRWGIVGTNVAESVKPPKIEYRKASIWTPAETGRFLDTAATHDLWPLWLLFVETGARQSELLALGWEDVDIDRGTLRIGRQTLRLLGGVPTLKDGGKSKAASRTIGVTPGTIAELRTYRRSWLARKLEAGPEWNPDGLLFATGSGKPLSSNNLRRTFDGLVKAAGVTPITPHAVRKTAITHAIANGASPLAVSQRVGHADSRVTLDVYSSITAGMDDQLMQVVGALVPPRSKATS